MRFTSLLLLSIVFATANADNVKWLADSYDFGTFRESGGPKEGFVKFINIGPDTTIINRVRPSCGCTGERHTEGLIAPGDTATVWFTYNPKGRPGRFAKTVKVYTGASNTVKLIPISGIVIGEPASLTPDYPEVGPKGMRFSTADVNFEPLIYGHTKHVYVKGYNQSSDTLHPKIVSIEPKGPVDVILSTDTVAPGDVFSISFYLNTRGGAPLGASSYKTLVTPDDGGDETFCINVHAEVLPQSASLSSEQLAGAPMLRLDATTIDATVKKGKAAFKIAVANAGESELLLLRVYSRAPEVKIKKVPVKLKPGTTGYVEGEITLEGINAPAFAYIVELITNDPRISVATVRVAGQMPK